MSCSMDKVLADARALVDRLKEHDSAAESLIEQTSALNKRVEAMKQYQEEVIELNEVARHRPRSALVLGIQQENRQIRELQQENKELRIALEEHQSALELIMGKYREQMVSLLSSNKTEENKLVLTLKEIHCKELQAQVEKVCEMAAVMKKAINADDAEVIREQEKMAQLEMYKLVNRSRISTLHEKLENKTLRDLLKISKESFMSVVEEAKLAGKAGD